MMNELFNKVVALDEMMNEASESGNMDAVDRYYEEQEQVMEEASYARRHVEMLARSLQEKDG